MSTQRFNHTVQLPEPLESAWKKYRQKHQEVSFNAFVLNLIAAALKVNHDGPTKVRRSSAAKGL